MTKGLKDLQKVFHAHKIDNGDLPKLGYEYHDTIRETNFVRATNLLSIFQFCDGGLQVTFNQNSWQVLDKDGKFLFKEIDMYKTGTN